MGFTAAYGPDLGGDKCKSGFPTEDAAEEYIKSWLCKGCKEDLERGHYEIGPDKNTEEADRIEVENVFHTNCGAEWFVLSDEHWETYLKVEDFGYLLSAAGFVPIDREEVISRKKERRKDD
jgi:hypothetical protein